VELLVSELVTNAVLHARSDVEVRLSTSDRGLRVDVADSSNRRPVMRTRDESAMTGRGLGLVAELSTEWGVDEIVDGGKSVWFVVAA
jgi:anti-sigma regulatory factor (Ser/Thr protein kinase)